MGAVTPGKTLLARASEPSVPGVARDGGELRMSAVTPGETSVPYTTFTSALIRKTKQHTVTRCMPVRSPGRTYWHHDHHDASDMIIPAGPMAHRVRSPTVDSVRGGG